MRRSEEEDFDRRRIVEQIRASVRGGPVAPRLTPGDWHAMPRRLKPLVAHRTEGEHPGLSEAARTDVLRSARVVWLARHSLLRRVDEALEAAGAPAVLLKGAAVCSRYPEPWLRPMGDVDLWVLPTDLGPCTPS